MSAYPLPDARRLASAPSASDRPNPASLASLRFEAGDDEEADPGPAVAQLARNGWLVACLPVSAGGFGIGTSADPDAIRATGDALRALGRANLALARLYEGHVNGVKLVEAHAGAGLRELVRTRVRAGTLLGVWGATAADPLAVSATDPHGWTLTGAKAFTSGLGYVGMAVVPVADPHAPERSRLLLVEVDDAERQHPRDWRASGMRATRSGGYRFDGLRLAPDRVLGEPGVYEREPWFEGGIWRYLAAHVGAMEALVDELVDELRERGRQGDPHQGARIGRAAALAFAARALVERVALEIETVDPEDAAATGRAVALALTARESVEAGAVELMALVERALGMAAFERGRRIERLRRDLGLYLRQAAPDAKLARAAATIADDVRGIGGWW